MQTGDLHGGFKFSSHQHRILSWKSSEIIKSVKGGRAELWALGAALVSGRVGETKDKCGRAPGSARKRRERALESWVLHGGEGAPRGRGHHTPIPFGPAK